VRDFHFDASSTLDEILIFNKSTDNAEGIMERAVGFLKDEGVRSS